MFGLFKDKKLEDNKQKIKELMYQATYVEKETLKKITDDIVRRMIMDSDFDPKKYFMLHGINFQNKYLKIKCGSSREMFQALRAVCNDAEDYDAEYYEHKDIASCTIIAGYKIELKITKNPTGTYISAYATIENKDAVITEVACELKKEYDTSLEEEHLKEEQMKKGLENAKEAELKGYRSPLKDMFKKIKEMDKSSDSKSFFMRKKGI